MDNSAPEQPASVGESRRLQDPIPSPQLTVLEQTSPEYDETRLVTHPHFWSHVLRVPARRVLVWAWTTLGVLTGTAVLFWFVRALDAVGLREFGDFMGLSREAMVLPRISRMGLWETLRPAAIAATGAIGWHVAVMGTVATFARATEFQHYQALRKSLARPTPPDETIGGFWRMVAGGPVVILWLVAAGAVSKLVEDLFPNLDGAIAAVLAFLGLASALGLAAWMYHLLENPEEADWQRETHRTESRLKSLVSKSNVTMHNIATLLDLDRDRENNGPMRKLLDALADVEASRAISTIDAVFQDVKGRGSQDLIVVQTNPAFKHILRLAKAGNEVAATWLTSYYLRYLQSRAINTSPANDAPAPRQEERSGTVHDAVALGWLRSILDHEGGELVHWREDLVAIVRSRDVPAELRGDLLDLLYRGFQDLGDLALMFREFGYGQKNGRPVFPDANDASLADIIAARIGRLTGEPDAVPWERRELKTAQLHHWFRCHRPSFMIIQALFEHHPSARMRRAAHDISKSFRGAWWRCFIYSLWRPYEDGWEIE